MLKTLEKPKTQQVGSLIFNHENSGEPVNVKRVVMGFGACRHSGCSCPGFYSGAGESTCWRSGCGHHYDEHW